MSILAAGSSWDGVHGINSSRPSGCGSSEQLTDPSSESYHPAGQEQVGGVLCSGLAQAVQTFSAVQAVHIMSHN